VNKFFYSVLNIIKIAKHLEGYGGDTMLLPVSVVGKGDDRRRGRPLDFQVEGCTDRLVASLFKRTRHSRTLETQKNLENQSVQSYDEISDLNY
jgi:hypothetical protein